MDIIIENEALEYINKNNLTAIYLTIEKFQTWSGIYSQPAVEEGRPEESYNEDYFRYVKDGLEIYVRSDVKSGKNGLTIYLGSLRFEEKLFVRGMV